jgi:hypothetical protein
VPMMKLIMSSQRFSDVLFWHKEGWFIPWQHLIQFIVPDFFGNPTTLNYWGVWNYGEFIGYIGVTTFIFFVISLLNFRKLQVKFWMAVFVVSIIFSTPNIVAYIPYILKIPFFSSVQPTRLMSLIDLAICIISVYGLDYWIKSSKINFKRTIIVPGLIMTLFWIILIYLRYSKLYEFDGQNINIAIRNLTQPTFICFVSFIVIFISDMKNLSEKRRNITFLLIFILIVDLFRFGWKYTPFTPQQYFFPTTKSISFLQKQNDIFRIACLNKEIFPPNVLSYYGIESLDGYDSFYSTRYEEYIASANRNKPDISPPFGFNRIVSINNFVSPLLSFANVKYVATFEDLNNSSYIFVFQEGKTKIYENLNFLPRFYITTNVINVTSKQEVLNQLYKSDLKTKPAIVEGQLNINKGFFRSDLVIKSYTANSVILLTSTDKDTFLVVGIPNDYKWKVIMDGKITETFKTNYLYQGLILPKGKHQLRLTYNY